VVKNGNDHFKGKEEHRLREERSDLVLMVLSISSASGAFSGIIEEGDGDVRQGEVH